MFGFGRRNSPAERAAAPGNSPMPEVDPAAVLAHLEEPGEETSVDPALEAVLDDDFRTLKASEMIAHLTQPQSFPRLPYQACEGELPPVQAAVDSWVLDIRHCSRHFRERLNRTLTIGRTDEDGGWIPDIDLTGDECVSRRHLRITVWGSRVTAEDLNSTNGTLLNGIWLEPGDVVDLRLGDVLQVGEHSLMRVMPLSAAPLPRTDDSPPEGVVEMLSGLVSRGEDGGGQPPASVQVSSKGHDREADVLGLALDRVAGCDPR